MPSRTKSTASPLNLEERLKALKEKFSEIQAEVFKIRDEGRAVYGNPNGWGAITGAALAKDWPACQLLYGVEWLLNDDDNALAGEPIETLEKALDLNEKVAKEEARSYLKGYFEGQVDRLLGGGRA